MANNNLFFIANKHYPKLDYIKNLLSSIQYSEQETKDGLLLTIHFQTTAQEIQFFATIKRNNPELLE